jgi:hypothetical protein
MATKQRAKKATSSRLGQAMRKAKRIARRKGGKKLGTSARRQRAARVKAKALRAPRRVTKIIYVRTRTKRVRYRSADPEGAWSPQSYASRQGARRAAKRQFKGTRVVCVPA